MQNEATKALHQVHTATNDVLKGYSEMLARAQPDIQAVMHRLTALHQRHAQEQAAELRRMQDAGDDDSSLQGTVNKAVVVLRDWLSNLDRDALPAVRDGEEALRDDYNQQMANLQGHAFPTVLALLTAQRDAIEREIALLPQA